ncbi:copia-type polyprotein [Trifolium pratense]|uniref:Copia-type polyprotein n=1 Tax=Trifolium pratense TaxID=57577 RepID=A0A2K3NIM5_TRIPR|nr:copia-type polyprotein [Trifolium pratense]
MVKGLPTLQETYEVCSDYATGKQSRDTIPKSTNWRASEKLQLVHSDICGPINSASNGGSRHFINFTGDFSRRTWTYPLAAKFNAFETFKKFKALVEKESNCNIQTLRTDKNGEFTSHEFNEFCSTNGIKRQLTAAYTPQQNGVSERNNKTLLNMVRSMLNGRNVPKRFWPEAVIWATYVMNKCPTLSVKDIKPEEAWSGVKPFVHYFKVFGCLAYAHVPDALRKKLDRKASKCINLGISEESKAYKLYDPIQKKIIISRDVKFDESKGWIWNKKSQKSQGQIEVAHSNDEENIIEGEVAEDNISESDSQEGEIADEQVEDTDGPDEDTESLVTNVQSDPTTYDEAAKHKVWRDAMDQEILSIEKNDTWELFDLPTRSKKICVKWIYKTKFNENGEVEKYKARLVAKGYSQQHGIDYNEVLGL